MAEVVIKGMTLPKTCGKCPLKVEANWGLYTCPFQPEYSFALVSTFRSDKCPMVELLPHGRLIDADAVERNLLKMQQAQTGACSHGVRKSRAVLRDAPTIIPASEETE